MNRLRFITAEVMQSLIELYESWNKSEKAEEWHAKLLKTKAEIE
jgi:hypothetical protein